MTGVFLQVRLDSTRYPRKALADLGGRTVLQRCLDALEGVPAQVHAVVTEPGSLEELSPLVRTAGWQVFSGSRTDVLDRYVQAARFFGCSTVVRATGDNPLVSARCFSISKRASRVFRGDRMGAASRLSASPRSNKRGSPPSRTLSANMSVLTCTEIHNSSGFVDPRFLPRLFCRRRELRWIPRPTISISRGSGAKTTGGSPWKSRTWCHG